MKNKLVNHITQEQLKIMAAGKLKYANYKTEIEESVKQNRYAKRRVHPSEFMMLHIYEILGAKLIQHESICQPWVEVIFP